MNRMHTSLLAALAMSASAAGSRIYGAAAIGRHVQQVGRAKNRASFNPKINRHTGKPHEHKREIARNLRQAARNAS